MRVNKCNEGGGAGVGMLLPGETVELSRDSGLWAEFWETLETNRAPVRNKNSDFRQFFWHVAYNFSKGIIIKSDFDTNSLPFASLRTDEDACKLSHYLQIFSKSLHNKVTFKKLIQPSSKHTDSLTLVFIFFFYTQLWLCFIDYIYLESISSNSVQHLLNTYFVPGIVLGSGIHG